MGVPDFFFSSGRVQVIKDLFNVSSSRILNMSTEVEGPKSSQGIPPAEFIEDVDAYMSKKADKETPDEVVQSMNEMYSKYKFMEQSLSTKKGRLNRQIPDIEQTLEMLRLLKKKKEAEEEITTDFLLTEQVYVKAKVPPTEKALRPASAFLALAMTGLRLLRQDSSLTQATWNATDSGERAKFGDDVQSDGS